jgi:hypothetical protein
MAKFATVQDLDKHLASRSYVTGYSLSAADKDALAALKSAPCASAQPHAYRWALHISALTGKRYSNGFFYSVLIDENVLFLSHTTESRDEVSYHYHRTIT